jgi:hypothetical protein
MGNMGVIYWSFEKSRQSANAAVFQAQDLHEVVITLNAIYRLPTHESVFHVIAVHPAG